jgi:hypothetical protein
MDIKDIQAGDIFSEVSHYAVQSTDRDAVLFNHIESNTVVRLSKDYVKNLLKSGDQYETEIEVGKEDKFWTVKQLEQAEIDKAFKTGEFPRVGDVRVKGIRTIWEELVTPHVFAVCFKKADKAKTKKVYAEELEAQRTSTIDLIDKAKRQKKSMAEAYRIALETMQLNPVKDYVEGESRVLRGFKIQFTSRDGKYDCIDMDIEVKGTESAVRPVNINTIEWLVFNGVKYTVK